MAEVFFVDVPVVKHYISTDTLSGDYNIPFKHRAGLQRGAYPNPEITLTTALRGKQLRVAHFEYVIDPTDDNLEITTVEAFKYFIMRILINNAPVQCGVSSLRRVDYNSDSIAAGINPAQEYTETSAIVLPFGSNGVHRSIAPSTIWSSFQVPANAKTMAFEFYLPDGALESYSGASTIAQLPAAFKKFMIWFEVV